MVARVTETINSGDDRADRMRQQRRAQIIQASKEVFAKKGYHNASINEIIQRAGIARGTFYLYFTSKHHVFDSILKQALEGLRGGIRRIDVSEGADPPQVQLRGSLLRVVRYIVGDPHFAQLIVSNRLAPDPEIGERATDFYSEVQEMIEHSLEQGIEMGLVRECDTKLIASALVGAVLGIVQHIVGSQQAPDEDLVVDELIAFVLRGVINF